ncbi:MAG: acyltransferase [Litorimonas sp.]
MLAQTSSNSPERLSSVQALRGLAACLVMVSHLWVIEQKYSPDQILGAWADFGQLGVDLFFSISGFIMVYVTWSVTRNPIQARRFLLARIFRIYPIYWLISSVLLGLWIIRPDIVFSTTSTDPNILKSFLLLPDKQAPLLAVGWTLIHEMFFYIVFAFSLLFPRKALLPILAVWSLITWLGYTLINHNASAEFALIFSPLNFEFILGACAAWVFKSAKHPNAKLQWAKVSLWLACVLWIGLALLALLNNGTMPLSHASRALVFSVPAALTLYAFASANSAGYSAPRWAVSIGDYSYGLYLTHVLTLSLLGRIWQMFAVDGPLDNIAALIIMSLASIAVSAVLWTFIEAPLMTVFKVKLRSKS